MNGVLMVRRTSSIPRTLRKRDGFNRNQRLCRNSPTPYCLLPTPYSLNHPSATSMAIITVKPAAKRRGPEVRPSGADSSGTSSATTT